MVETLRPPADIAGGGLTTVDGRPVMSARSFAPERLERPPKPARVGLTRYDALRVPREDGDESGGYVSVSLVADPIGAGCFFTLIDAAVDTWLDAPGEG